MSLQWRLHSNVWCRVWEDWISWEPEQLSSLTRLFTWSLQHGSLRGARLFTCWLRNPRHVSKETEKKREVESTRRKLCHLQLLREVTEYHLCHMSLVGDITSPHMNSIWGGTQVPLMMGGRLEGRYIDVAIFGIYSLPQCKEVGK